MKILSLFKFLRSTVVIIICAVCIASCEKVPEEQPTDKPGDCEAVDLGLSVKWAPFNVGAKSAEESGYYFAWGETWNKERYRYLNPGDYKWGVYSREKADYGMTKYTGSIDGGDGLTELQPTDDPATRNWGSKWRTPTYDEVKELLDETNCKWTWENSKGRQGYTVTSLKNGNSIFFPAAGVYIGADLADVSTLGEYWTSSLVIDFVLDANILYLRETTPPQLSQHSESRCCGLTVRAVTSE